MMVDFYGDQGFWFHTDRFPVRRTAWATTSRISVRQPFSKSRSQRQPRPIECGWYNNYNFRAESLYDCKTYIFNGRGHIVPSASSSSASSRHHLLCNRIGHGQTVV